MTAKSITDALALAAYELAEAETEMLRAEHALRQARRRHVSAALLIADLHTQVQTAADAIRNPSAA